MTPVVIVLSAHEQWALLVAAMIVTFSLAMIVIGVWTR